MKYVAFLVLLPSMALGQECIDPDGDGWGWDGQQSCLIENTQTHPPTTTRPTCLNPAISDPDGDGYGWENNATCTVSNSNGNNASDATASTWPQVLAGKWQCQGRFPWLSGVRTAPQGFLGWSTIDSWEAVPKTCASNCGVYGSYHTMTFTDNLVAIEHFQSHEPGQNLSLSTEAVPWSINDFIFTLNGIPTQKYAFENSEGNQYFHYYSDDTNRVTCKIQ